MADSPKFETVSTKRERIATLAKQSHGRAFLSLNHYLDFHWLETAFGRTRKDGAVGVDGQTAAAQDELAAALRRLSAIEREIVRLRSEDYTVEELSYMTGKPERGIKRILATTRDALHLQADQ